MKILWHANWPEWRQHWAYGAQIPAEVTHQSPPEGGVMPCCGLTPFEVPRFDRITLDPALVTCQVVALNSTTEEGQQS